MNSRRTWFTKWVMVEAIAVIIGLAWFVWPRGNGSQADEGVCEVGGAEAQRMEPCVAPQPAGAPITRDSSVRTAEDVATGTQAEFDTLIADVRSLDSTILVDLRYRGVDNFTGAPLPGYEGNRAMLRREAASALARVQAALKSDGLGLIVYDGYRPVRATEAMVAWTVRVHREDLVTDGYISDRSRHNLGVAIDCTLIDLRTRKPLEMGTPYDSFSKDAHTANATGVAASNRAKFVAAMAREGFKNYEQEWWHFSYEVPAPSLRRFDIVIR